MQEVGAIKGVAAASISNYYLSQNNALGLYIHCPIRLHSVVRNLLSTGTTLPYQYLRHVGVNRNARIIATQLDQHCSRKFHYGKGRFLGQGFQRLNKDTVSKYINIKYTYIQLWVCDNRSVILTEDVCVSVNIWEPVSCLQCKDYEMLCLLFCMGLKPGWSLALRDGHKLMSPANRALNSWI
jgi:hypothetical protein